MEVEQEGETAGLSPDSSLDPAPAQEEEEEEERPDVWWAGQEAEPEQGPPRASGARWDFSAFSFPDLGSRGPLPRLAAPDPALLPGPLSVGPCDVAPWLRRLNTQKERLTQRERDRARYRRDVNRDREVRRCGNWAEYRHLLERRSQRSRRERPAHLWEGEVKPLLQPGQCASPGDLMKRIGVIQSSHWQEGVSRPGQDSAEWTIFFNVYQPDSVADFKKSSPGKPYTRMCVCRFDSPVPDLRTLKLLSFQSGDVPVTFAVVDHGDISFYTFKSFRLPTDLSH
ncbi:hypothetical protein COCON_G00211030 [Conger conger]|uniref:Uncharacterized protein n=1 Tax=Conger conger TaxID=82655 RepID=A0A9Q1D0U2_CONCO|nr:hypothetical protein COCON_G00211030 [Conger conger]